MLYLTCIPLGGILIYMKKVTDRLRRVRGQIESIEQSIATKKSCDEVIPQLLAIKGAIQGIVRTYLEESLEACATDVDAANMKQVIKTLIKHS